MKRIDSRELTEFGIQFLCAYGASPSNAAIITGHLVDNDLKGVESQGAMRLFEYARFMAEGQVNGQAAPAVQEAAPNVFRVDGSRGFGIVAMEMAVEKMLQALSGGRATAVAAVTGVGHTGRVGAYSEALAKHFCFGCVYGGGGHKEHPSVAPFGGAKGVMSTNPVALAMPGMDGVPLSADFATSASGGGKLRLAQRKGTLLPEGQILDRNGNPSVRPEDYFDGGVMLPAAGPKGSGLGMINELLCYGLLGDPVEFNWFLTAVRLDLFCSEEDYTHRTEEFLTKVTQTPPRPGFDAVCYPGQYEARLAAERRISGVSISDSTAQRLVSMAQERGVSIPPALL